MASRRRVQFEPTDEWQQLQFHLDGTEQTRYELIRPVVVFGAPPVERAKHTEVSASTIYRRVSPFEALEPLRQGIRQHFDGYREGVAAGLALRHDHGPQFLSDHFQAELRFLGVASSPAFVREPEGNRCAERLILLANSPNRPA